MLLGLKSTDIDLAAALSAEEFLTLGFRLVEGRSTSAIWFHHTSDSGTMEVTPIRDTTSLTDDLQRRDFCCNALAMTLSGEIIDPLGGRDDLDRRLLRACSHFSFIEDPHRIFRAFRFLADGWNMSVETEELLRGRDWTTGLAVVPVERFSREMFKALGMRSPERFFEAMLEYGIGKDFLPEIFRMPSIPAGPLEHHPEGDLFSHSVQILQRVAAVSTDPLTRFCAFFHDIGKLATSPADYPRHHGHNETGASMAVDFCRRLRLPAQYGSMLACISRLHGTFNTWDRLRNSTRIRTAEQAIKAGVVEILPLVSAADKGTTGEPVDWRAALQIAGMPTSELGIDPGHLEGMQPLKRRDYILQKRVERFRAIQTSSA
jgi:tRNA nucleotidyltransferase (CCA-adding enzyme)